MREKEKVIYRMKWAGIVLCAYLFVWSLSRIMLLHGEPTVFWGGQYFGYNITSVALFGLDIFLLKRWISRKNKRLKILSAIGGGLMAMLIVYGAYAHFVNNIFFSAKDTFLQFGYMIAIAFLTVPLFAELFVIVEKGELWYQKAKAVQMQKLAEEQTDGQETREEKKKSKRFRWNSKTYFLSVWAGLFMCYLPIFLANWPGNFNFDAKYQIANVITGDYSTHHPLIHTLMMGKAYQFGQSLGNVSVGFQLYTLTQMLILSASFAYFLLYLYKRKAPKLFQVICVLWFALFPMHALFSISSTKDVLCAAFFLFFMVFVVRYFFEGEKFKWYSYAGMIVSGVCLCLFRNNALYAVIVAAVFVAVMVKGWKKRVGVVLVVAVIYLLTNLVNEGLISYTNAYKDTDKYRESMSVPLQCLARVACYRGDELSPELYEEICYYLEESTIEKYNPYLADPIKNEANEQLLKSNLGNFFKLWLKVGLQFPDEYIENIITNTFGYWNPFNQGVYVGSDISLYHTLIGIGDEIEKKSFCPWADTFYSSLFWTKTFYSVPLLGYSFRNAPYVWMVLFFMLWCIYKKDWKSLKIGWLPLMYLGTCMLGPWAALRYIYCLVVTTPLLIHTMLGNRGQQTE